MDFTYFEKWVLKEFNLDLSAYKSNQLHRRINSLMSRVGSNSVEDYIKLLKSNPAQKQKFLDFITINVTEFFRNPSLFEELKENIKILLELNKNTSLKIWSAACSIGAEPYSIGILLDELSPGIRHKIIATDIDSTILEKAKKGRYSSTDVKNIAKDRLKKYFNCEGETYIINDKIKNMVEFKKHDLILEDYDTKLDLIVCRNVVIYFNQDVKDKMYSKFRNSLKTNGLLFVGATESIYNYREFGYEKASSFIYRKV
jgi:chemotaxis protein methyltransferase CheR